MVRIGKSTKAFIHPCSYPGNSPNVAKSLGANQDEESVSQLDLKKSEEELLYKIYPNPTKGNFRIQLSEENIFPSSIIIDNILGQEIKKITEINEDNISVDLNGFGDGVYLIHINYPGKVMTDKIVKTSSGR